MKVIDYELLEKQRREHLLDVAKEIGFSEEDIGIPGFSWWHINQVEDGVSVDKVRATLIESYIVSLECIARAKLLPEISDVNPIMPLTETQLAALFKDTNLRREFRKNIVYLCIVSNDILSIKNSWIQH